jgi:signal transduction histidine kinase/CheY-like chemotaxis protein
MKRNYTIRYTIVGAIFGLCFPIVATLLDILVQSLPVVWSSIEQVQSSQPLHWIIDTAPVFLGFAASLAGVRQDALKQAFEKQEDVIEERTSSLKNRNQQLRAEIERRKKLEAELIHAKEEALEAKSAEERFLANMSHEIRTPLNSIVGFTRLMMDTEINAKQTEYLKSVKYSSNHLLAIINDILELSKIKAGQLELEQVAIPAHDLFHSVINTVMINAQNKGLDLKTEIHDNVPKGIKGDAVRMGQILLNLLNNAIKFTNQGAVKLTVAKVHHQVGDFIRVEVCDTGIGISDEKLSAVFDDFKQAESSTTRLYGGTGLGLSISKKLVELHSGKIGVNSKLGEGSTFWFEVPCIPCNVKEDSDSEFTNKISEHEGFEARILLAEDNDMNRALAQNIFSAWGDKFQLTCVENGKAAIEELSENDYDLILMDLQMPVMDGFTACEFIRKEMDPPKRDIPVIALTADVLSAERKKAFRVGMNEYVTKPFKPEDLYFKMFKVVQGQRA